jgi:hypothetical protein
MKPTILKHCAGRGYNSPLHQDKTPAILKPVKEKRPSFSSKTVTGTGPRNSEEAISKGRAMVNKARENTVGPSGTDIDASDKDQAKLKKQQKAQRMEESMRK